MCPHTLQRSGLRRDLLWSGLITVDCQWATSWTLSQGRDKGHGRGDLWVAGALEASTQGLPGGLWEEGSLRSLELASVVGTKKPMVRLMTQEESPEKTPHSHGPDPSVLYSGLRKA